MGFFLNGGHETPKLPKDDEELFVSSEEAKEYSEEEGKDAGDPSLVADQIAKLLVDNDLIGSVVVLGPNAYDTRINLRTSWCGLNFIENEGQICYNTIPGESKLKMIARLTRSCSRLTILWNALRDFLQELTEMVGIFNDTQEGEYLMKRGKILALLAEPSLAPAVRLGLENELKDLDENHCPDFD